MFFTAIIYVCLLSNYFGFAADIGERCVPNNSVSEGVCKVVTDCSEAVRLIRNRQWQSHMFQRCGFNGDQEVVCCPEEENKFGPTTESVPSWTDNSRISQRRADQECKKIVDSRIVPLNLHIIGGELAALGEFPHMVAIGFDRGNGGYEFDCGGSLISSTYVLTAAHCIDTLDRIEPSIVRAGVVELGSNQLNDDVDYRIVEIKKHPDYKRREKYHDLALLRLDRAVPFSSAVNAACLYTSETDPTIPLTVTGWGQTSTAMNAACLYTSETDPTIPLTVTGWGQTSTASTSPYNIT
ncbi:trypsin domain-containing protein [Phthorimaea operculella]|nr:trypsin domain-containing protein [Phthorimaea operculella]